jgi:acetyl esterase/lipase
MADRPEDDARLDPRARRFLSQLPRPLFYHEHDASSREEALAIGNAPQALAEREASVALLEMMDADTVTPSAGLRIERVEIPSQPDGNRILLQIIRPDTDEVLPCVYYIHGGAMMESSCFHGHYRAWGKLMAHSGLCVVMVDFRNSLSPSAVPDVAPFPAGLNDCLSGWRWTCEHVADWGGDPGRLLLSGTSGGGNLAIASTLSLVRDGEALPLGLYALCPYIAGLWPQECLPSSRRNEGILISVHNNHPAMAYGIEALEAGDPLAWPLFAESEALRGFPPTMISVNECDPLRDEGILFYRRLLEAGVSAQCREVRGTMHANELFVALFPDIARATASDLRAWVDECIRQRAS